MTDLLAWIARSLPLREGPLTLGYLGASEGPEGPEVELELSLSEDGQVVSSAVQRLSLASLEVSDPEELAARATARMREPRFALGVATPGQLLAPPFRPIAREALPASDPLGYTLYERLCAQANGGGFDARFERLDGWPREARTVYFLVLAHSMLGGQGLEVFLAQAPLEDVMGLLSACEEAHCDRLAVRVRQGLTQCAKDGAAELLQQVDDAWIEDQGLPVPPGKGRVWSRIDSKSEGGTWWLLEHELAPALETYLRAHRAALVRS